MPSRKAQRKITAATLMAGLLIVYLVSPPAAWATLAGFAVAWLLAQPGTGSQEPRTEDQRVITPPPAPALSLARQPGLLSSARPRSG